MHGLYEEHGPGVQEGRPEAAGPWAGPVSLSVTRFPLSYNGAPGDISRAPSWGWWEGQWDDGGENAVWAPSLDQMLFIILSHVFVGDLEVPRGRAGVF